MQISLFRLAAGYALCKGEIKSSTGGKGK